MIQVKTGCVREREHYRKREKKNMAYRTLSDTGQNWGREREKKKNMGYRTLGDTGQNRV